MAVREMLPYFFASGHMHYARYGLYYIRSMEKLPGEVLQHFLKGEHVMRHKAGIWNGMWSDMFIETTFMRYGHSAGGIVGITLNPNALKRWAFSMHICTQLAKDVEDMREGSPVDVVTTHKEEKPSRITSDHEDRAKLRQKLQICIDPLDCGDHPSDIVNVVIGRVGSKEVNVDDAVTIGHRQMQ